jgi:hypothetical protein
MMIVLVHDANGGEIGLVVSPLTARRWRRAARMITRDGSRHKCLIEGWSRGQEVKACTSKLWLE